ELLQKNGYYTIGSTVAEFMSEREKFERGFSKFACVVDSRGQSSNRFGFSQLVNLLGDDGWKGLPQPFFAWVHLKGGHDPLAPIEPEFLARHSRDLSPDVLPPSLKSGHEGLTPAQLRSSDQWYAYYDANLSEADSTIEALYRSLVRGNRLANTVLIITADHGETFDHGIMEEHWLSPWQSTLHVPLIIHAPKRLKAGRVKDRIVSTEDFAPTVLDLLGIAYRDERWAGGSAFAARRRTSLAAESPYSTAYTAALQQSAAKPAAEVRSQIAELKDTGLFYWTWIERSVKGPLYKLIYFDPGRNEGLPQGFQLYDLNRDPMENNDLLRSGRVTRRQARGILARAREKSPFFAVPPEMNRTPRAGTTTLGQPVQGLSPETIEILRSLGYVQ
ncbi:MAG: sulfatase family protein, partial [Thermoanaerobaculia bacterium]